MTSLDQRRFEIVRVETSEQAFTDKNYRDGFSPKLCKFATVFIGSRNIAINEGYISSAQERAGMNAIRTSFRSVKDDIGFSSRIISAVIAFDISRLQCTDDIRNP